MREILFRGKTQNCSYQENDKWIYGYYVKQENRHIIVDTTKGCLGFGLEVDEKTIGQFTGLTDKNGKKIFEGDIVKCDSRIGTVVFNNCCFFVLCKNSDWSFNCFFNIEVIGNIHDNPNLLKE